MMMIWVDKPVGSGCTQMRGRDRAVMTGDRCGDAAYERAARNWRTSSCMAGGGCAAELL